jgi:hypothetical protein
MAENRDLLITLALTTLNIEQLAVLERRLKNLTDLDKEAIDAEFNINAGKDFEEFIKRLEEAEINVKEFDKALKDLSGVDLDKLKKDMAELQKRMEQTGKEAETAAKESKDSTDDIIKSLIEGARLGVLNREQVNRLNQAYAETQAELAKGNLTLKERIKLTKQEQDLKLATLQIAKQEGGISGRFAAIQELVHRRGGFLGAAAFATGRLGFYAIAAGIIFNTVRALQEGVAEAVKFETALTKIRGVLPSRSEMAVLRIERDVVDLAVRYGESISAAADSARVFAQTGMAFLEVARFTEAAMVAVRGANLELEQAQELLIAIRNISQGEIDPFDVLDRISRVESRRAIAAGDIADALQILGPLARALRSDMAGVVDEFDAIIGATTAIVERTRVSGKAAATSLKFVLSRMGNSQILRNIQTLTGIELARPGGRQLRPFVEILEDLSAIYQRLQDQGRSAEAFQLLTLLGGSRQIQATSALLEDFARDSLQVAQIASLAFGDSLERTNLSLNTTEAQAQRVKAAWAAVGNEIMNNPMSTGVIQGALSLLTTTLQGTANSLRFVAEASKVMADLNRGNILRPQLGSGIDEMERLMGLLRGEEMGTRFQTTFMDLSRIDLQEIPRLKRLVTMAQTANVELDELIQTILGVAGVMAEDVKTENNVDSISDLLQAIADGDIKDELRGTREEAGIGMARELAPTISAFSELLEQFDSMEEGAARTKLAGDIIKLSMNTLGDVVFATAGVMQTHINRLRDNAKVFSELLVSDFEEAAERILKVERETLARSSEGPFSRFVRAGDAANPLRTIERDVDRVLRNIGVSMDGVAGITDPVFRVIIGGLQDIINNAEETSEILKDVLSSIDIHDADRAAKALDKLAVALFGPTGTRREDAISSVMNDMARALGHLPDAADGFGLAPGSEAIAVFTNIMTIAGERLIKTLEGQEDKIAEVRELMRFYESQAVSLVETLITTDTAIGTTTQRFVEMVGSIVEATQVTEALERQYARLGLFFDAESRNINTFSRALEEVVGILPELTKNLAVTETQIKRLELRRTELQEQTGRVDDSDAFLELVRNNELLAQIMSDGSADIGQEISTQTQAFKGFEEDLRQIQGNVLRLFDRGDYSQALRQSFLSIFDIFSQETISMDEAAAVVLTLRDIENALADQFATLQKIRLEREKEQQVLRESIKMLQMEAQLRQRSVGIEIDALVRQERNRLDIMTGIFNQTGQVGKALDAQLQSEVQLMSLEKRRARAQAGIRVGALQEELDKQIQIIDLHHQGQEVVENINAVREKAVDLEQQILEINEELALTLRDIFNNTRDTMDALRDQAALAAFVNLTSQVNANILSASSGIRTLLTDVTAARGGQFFDTLLGPIGSTFMGRTVDEFIQSMLIRGDGVMAQWARRFTETTEQKLQREFVEAWEKAGEETADVLHRALLDAGYQIAEMIHGRAPVSRGTSFGGAGLNAINVINAAAAQFQESSEDLEKATRRFELTAEDYRHIGAIVGSQLGGHLGGGGPRAGMGGQLGSSVGAMFFGPLGIGISGLVGGLLGGLFDRDKDVQQRQASSLERIEWATERNVEILELQNRMLETARGAVNIPSGFVIPPFMPSVGARRIDQTNHISAEIHVSGVDNPQQVVETIRQEFGDVLAQELRNVGRR